MASPQESDKDQIESASIRFIYLLFVGSTVACIFAASAALIALATNYKTPLIKKSYGMMGEAPAAMFFSRRAGRFYTVGLNHRVSFKLAYPYQKENFLTIKANGQKMIRDLAIGYGIHRFSVPASKGPVFIEFSWHNNLPREGTKESAGVILHQLPTTEYSLFHNFALAAGFLAAIAIFIFIFFRKGVNLPGLWIFWVVFCALQIPLMEKNPILLIGDEPHYLIQAESIVRDGDLDVRNQYFAQTGSLYARPFSTAKILTELKNQEGDHTKSPRHYPGMGLLLLPAFSGDALPLQIDPPMIGKYIIIALTALLSSLLMRWSLSTFGRRGFLMLLFLVAMPYLMYGHQIFSEIPAALITVVLTLPLLHSRKISYLYSILCLCLVALHIKYAPLAVLYGLWILYRASNDRSRFRLHGLILCSGASAVFAYGMIMYGSILGPYGNGDWLLRDIGKRYLQYFFDADLGLLALNPLLIFALPGLIFLFRRDRLNGIFLSAILLMSHLPNLLHTVYLLGACPVGRYWIVAYPLLAMLSLQGLLRLSGLSDVSRLEGCYGVRCIKNFRAIALPRALVFILIVFAATIAMGQTIAAWQAPEKFYIHLLKPFVAAQFWRESFGIDFSFLFARYPFNDTKLQLMIWIFLTLLPAIYALISRKKLAP